MVEGNPADQSRVERVLQAFVEASREVRLLQETIRTHRDTMLTWAIGLMGGGLLAVVNLASGPCSALGAQPLIWAASPWGAGVLFAVIGRIASAYLSQTGVLLSVTEVFEIRSNLARGLDAKAASELLDKISAGAKESETGTVKFAKKVSLNFYYLTLLALLVGMISVFLKVATTC
jgi:hypothetical protein